jgi:hypothetical protein
MQKLAVDCRQKWSAQTRPLSDPLWCLWQTWGLFDIAAQSASDWELTHKSPCIINNYSLLFVDQSVTICPQCIMDLMLLNTATVTSLLSDWQTPLNLCDMMSQLSVCRHWELWQIQGQIMTSVIFRSESQSSRKRLKFQVGILSWM